MSKPTAVPKEDHLPDLGGEDDVHSEPTRVGVPEERATSKMSPFQLDDVLKRIAEPPAERSQTRMKAPSVPPQDPVFDRLTVPAEIPAPIAEPPVTPPRSDVSAPTVLIAAVFVVLTCAVLFAR
jgi:hypothetical protein